MHGFFPPDGFIPFHHSVSGRHDPAKSSGQSPDFNISRLNTGYSKK
jgi:hypothetical protein